jgi:hypothetical protein
MLSDADIDRIALRVVALLRATPANDTLLTKSELATHLRVREAQIDRFVRRGMPRETVGTRPRFRLADCAVWLKANAEPAPVPISPTTEPVLPPGVRRLVRRARSA